MLKHLSFCSLLIFSFLTIAQVALAQTDSKSGVPKYVLVVHGGAGNFTQGLPDSVKAQIVNGLTNALEAGQKILEANGKAIDAVEAAVRVLEDDPNFNAGKGAVLTSEGHAEMDASIMDGSNLAAGAVGDVKTVKNPISLARLVMGKTNHILLVSEGAEKFADSMHVERRPASYFIVPARYADWKRTLPQKQMGNTVGAVALDNSGNIAAATSTGGMSGKMPGRLGDSPIIGAGTYANNATCAVSGTGWGEKFIKNAVAFSMSALMEFKHYTLKQASEEVISQRLSPGDGGLIAVDKSGNYTMPFSTKGMPRGVVTSSGEKKILLFKEN